MTARISSGCMRNLKGKDIYSLHTYVCNMARIDYVRRNELNENDVDVIAFLQKKIGVSELIDRIQMKACGGCPDEYEL